MLRAPRKVAVTEPCKHQPPPLVHKPNEAIPRPAQQATLQPPDRMFAATMTDLNPQPPTLESLPHSLLLGCLGHLDQAERWALANQHAWNPEAASSAPPLGSSTLTPAFAAAKGWGRAIPWCRLQSVAGVQAVLQVVPRTTPAAAAGCQLAGPERGCAGALTAGVVGAARTAHPQPQLCSRGNW